MPRRAHGPPPHPGYVLLYRFLLPRRMLQREFASAIGMHEANLCTFIAGRRGLTPWMAWAFAKVLRTKPQYWMQLQGEYDLWQARPAHRVKRARSAGRTPLRHRRRHAVR